MSGIIELQSVTKNYHLGKVTVKALVDITFSIKQGDFLAISGPSGSGKTTLLNIIGCIDTASSGKIVINGTDLSSSKEKLLSHMRRDAIGFIFQTFNLIPVLNVYENIELPLLAQKHVKMNKKVKAKINELVEQVGLIKQIKHKPFELSGGQRQRVAIARALITNPKIILADEPTANLDSVTAKDIVVLMKKINQERKTTFVFSSHDPMIVDIADYVIKLRDGMTESG